MTPNSISTTKAMPSNATIRHAAAKMPIWYAPRSWKNMCAGGAKTNSGARRPASGPSLPKIQQQAHERKRIGHENRVVIGLELTTKDEEQPHERDRYRDQRPAELIGVRLHLVDEQRRILDRVLQRIVNLRHAEMDFAIIDDEIARADTVSQLDPGFQSDHILANRRDFLFGCA
jgi:hypothetical protein